MKMTLRKRAELCSELYAKERSTDGRLSEWDRELVFQSAAMAGSRLTRRENAIVINRPIIKGVPLYKRRPDDCETNFRFKKAYAKVNEYIEKDFDITPGRLKTLLDILTEEGLDNDKWDDYYWSQSKNLRKRLGHINGMRRLEGMESSPLEIYDFSFETLYELPDILPMIACVDSLVLLVMYWIQRENGVPPVIVPSAGDDFDEYENLMETGARDSNGLKAFRNHMHRLLEHSLKQYQKSAEGKLTTASRDRILELVEQKPRHTAKTMATCLGLSEKGVRKQIALLKAEGRLVRVGPDKGGYWQVCRPLLKA